MARRLILWGGNMKYRIVKYANGKYGLEGKMLFIWDYLVDRYGLMITYDTLEEAEKGLHSMKDDPYKIVEIIKR